MSTPMRPIVSTSNGATGNHRSRSSGTQVRCNTVPLITSILCQDNLRSEQSRRQMTVARGGRPTAVRPVVVDRTSPIPLYFQVASRLQELIESGEIGVGARIENEVDLAERLGVSRPTTRRAIQYLVERGLLVRKRGVGTQVVHPKVRRPVELSSLHDDLVAAGRRPRTEVLSAGRRPATAALAEALGV